MRSPKPGNNKALGKNKRQLTIQYLGWTRERARQVRAKLSAFAAEWDDPAMDIYDEHALRLEHPKP